MVVFFILPVLGLHPDSIPRFRDCFLGDKQHPELEDNIFIYTRVGGNNRADFDMSILTKRKDFITTYDDPEDNTYWMYVHKMPKKYERDIKLILAWEIKSVSQKYKDQLYKVYPKLKDQFDLIFKETN